VTAKQPLGTGELSFQCYKSTESIYLFIGGSATNDGGISVAAALASLDFRQIRKRIIADW
jgi:glycerate kinase